MCTWFKIVIDIKNGEQLSKRFFTSLSTVQNIKMCPLFQFAICWEIQNKYHKDSSLAIQQPHRKIIPSSLLYQIFPVVNIHKRKTHVYVQL